MILVWGLLEVCNYHFQFLMNILRSSAKVVGLIAGVGVVGVGAAACIYDGIFCDYYKKY